MAVVNDTIANALDTIQCRVVSYNEEWDTGISLPVSKVEEEQNIFPVQKYDWNALREKIEEYVDCVVRGI